MRQTEIHLISKIEFLVIFSAKLIDNIKIFQIYLNSVIFKSDHANLLMIVDL